METIDTRLSYHGDPALKARLIAEANRHREQGMLVKGVYWKNGKGCAVGCLLRDPSGGHWKFPIEFGIPEFFARLDDAIFEGLPDKDAQLWPARFLEAIPVGVIFEELERAADGLAAWCDEPLTRLGIEDDFIGDRIARVRLDRRPDVDGVNASHREWSDIASKFCEVVAEVGGAPCQ